MPFYTQDEVEVYTRMLARAYESVREFEVQPTEKPRQEALLKEIERTLGWNVPPPRKARPPEKPTKFRDDGMGI